MVMVESPSCASIFTRIGYLSTHFGVTVLDGKTCWTQETAVSRSCAPPSQLRDYALGNVKERDNIQSVSIGIQMILIAISTHISNGEGNWFAHV